MNRKFTALSLCACCLLFLSACLGPGVPSPPQSRPPEGAPTPGAVETAAPTPSPAPSAPPSPSPTASGPMTDGEIIRRYARAIADLEPTVTLDVAGRTWTFGPENDLKNLYYQALSQDPGLKYAYDMTAAVSGDAAQCTFFYMPYKTGAYADGLPAGSHTVANLRDADVMAQSMIGGTQLLSIAITDPALEVEDLQRAVGQGGYGWIVCSLSRDGTELLAAPTTGMTLSQCTDSINETFRLAGGILEETVTGDMTDREKVQAVYTYLTENVAYDFRYYSGKNDMPFTSTVALGALRDHLAICGGYAHALETLLDMCGVKNYTVSGVSQGEYHAWNYVVLDGEGYYCDPTADRGGGSRHFLLTGEELSALGGYQWDAEFYERLAGVTSGGAGA